jgi:hypothetical protein
MTDAREIIAKALEWEFGAAAGEWSDEIVDALHAAGYRILAPGELDKETVEKCVIEMEVNWGHICTPEMRDAIRSLEVK